MSRIRRHIIRIDEEKCNGCGLCLPGCPEGALRIVDGKARLVRESYCDGLGACLGHCPQGALRVEERAAEQYDACGVLAYLGEQSPELAERHREHLRAHGLAESGRGEAEPGAGCPSAQVIGWGAESLVPHSGRAGEEAPENGGSAEQAGAGENFTALGHWPVKLRLIPPAADFLKNADLILAADCVPFAYGNFHRDFLRGRAVAAGCPKFDDVGAYREKIEQMLESVNIRSITVVYMEISCCSGFVRLVREALERSGSGIPLETVQIGVRGEFIIEKE